jgi:hypothetical protein
MTVIPLGLLTSVVASPQAATSGTWIVHSFLSEEYFVLERDAVQSGKVRRRFGGTYCHHLQDGRVAHVGKQQKKAVSRALTDPEIGDNTCRFHRVLTVVYNTQNYLLEDGKRSSFRNVLILKNNRFLPNVGEQHGVTSQKTVPVTAGSSTCTTCLHIKNVSTLPRDSLIRRVWLSQWAATVSQNSINQLVSMHCTFPAMQNHKISCFTVEYTDMCMYIFTDTRKRISQWYHWRDQPPSRYVDW